MRWGFVRVNRSFFYHSSMAIPWLVRFAYPIDQIAFEPIIMEDMTANSEEQLPRFAGEPRTCKADTIDHRQ
jgi:hypothetical protein